MQPIGANHQIEAARVAVFEVDEDAVAIVIERRDAVAEQYLSSLFDRAEQDGAQFTAPQSVSNGYAAESRRTMRPVIPT
jgi:hypothetical protein